MSLNHKKSIAVYYDKRGEKVSLKIKAVSDRFRMSLTPFAMRFSVFACDYGGTI